MKGIIKKVCAGTLSAIMLSSAFCLPLSGNNLLAKNEMLSAKAQTVNDMPSEYEYAANWIWENRIAREHSTERWNTLFDQLIAGKGTLNYVVKWQSYKQITPEQRKGFQRVLSDAINAWNDKLAGYENWPYDHIDVKIVGWAVIDKNSIIDPAPDEIIYTDTKYYDSQYDTSNGTEEIPNLEPYAPDELSRMYHFEHRLDPTFDAYNYPGGLDKRFDMYMWATQGFPAIGGCGGDWGQRLSDTAYLNMIDGSFPHVQVHEVGHAFGITDFYGGEGAIDGFPPGGFPGNGTSIMMAGSSTEITDFDGWLLRYMWTKIKDENGRFDMANALPDTTTTTTTTTYTDTTTTTTTVTTTTTEPVDEKKYLNFEDGELLAFKNLESGLYMGAENTENVNAVNFEQIDQNVWTVKNAGNGYYYLYSRIQGGEKYLLDVYYALADDGTNIGLYEFTDYPSQCFRFADNGDGSVCIETMCSDGKSCLDILNGNVIQNANQNKNSQKWIINKPNIMGYKGDLNGDDNVSVADCIKMNKFIVGIESLSDITAEFKDVNSDGRLNIFDVSLLKEMCVSKEKWITIYDFYPDIIF